MEEFIKDGLRKMLIGKRREFEEELIKTERFFREEIQTRDLAYTKTHTADSCDVPSINKSRLTNLRKCLLKIEEALERVAEGTYGTCERCGEQIILGRLEAVPFTRYCVPCKTIINSNHLFNGRVGAVSREPAH